MPIEFEIADADVDMLTDAFRKQSIDFKLSNRRGFDGVAVASLVVDAVAALGSIATPIIVHLLTHRKSDESEIIVNGISVRGLNEDQVRRIIDDLVHDQTPADGD